MLPLLLWGLFNGILGDVNLRLRLRVEDNFPRYFLLHNNLECMHINTQLTSSNIEDRKVELLLGEQSHPLFQSFVKPLLLVGAHTNTQDGTLMPSVQIRFEVILILVSDFVRRPVGTKVHQPFCALMFCLFKQIILLVMFVDLVL